ncbi:EF-hand domain-containing protein [Streptomyces sp. MS1.AVA.3]|uniref:EF-hand domain-containing protein n=1 Tax=Streptomyces decoyicus TaxID=249567 RepID=UPI0030C25F78
MRSKGADSRPARLRTFFRQGLDQTGDGRISSAGLQAMAHNVCWPLELTPEREARVYAAFETWWQHLRTGMDADDNGQVTCEEFVTAMLTGIDTGPAYLEQVIRIAPTGRTGSGNAASAFGPRTGTPALSLRMAQDRRPDPRQPRRLLPTHQRRSPGHQVTLDSPSTPTTTALSRAARR